VLHAFNVGQGSSTLLEFPSCAILVDAGGESTPDDDDLTHLLGFSMTSSCDAQTSTLNSVIITHAHIDHTRFLNDVLQRYRVKALIDGGGTTGSGIVPLRAARAFAQANGIRYEKVLDQQAANGGKTNKIIDPFRRAGDPNIRILAAGRGCANENNESLAIHVSHQGKNILITGDAESTNAADCANDRLTKATKGLPAGSLHIATQSSELSKNCAANFLIIQA
jgi:beta-lactamase superfamily II metal-dependent hydrolase